MVARAISLDFAAKGTAVTSRRERSPDEGMPSGELISTGGPGPLAGLRVLDLSWVLAGPFATRLLGDLGADVIKVQTEERATLVNRPDFPYYPVWNRSKRSVTLDLKAPGALDAVRPLVEQADILVEVFEVLQRLRLRYQLLQHQRGDRPSDVVVMDRMSPIDRSVVAQAVREISSVQRRMDNVSVYVPAEAWASPEPS